MKHGIIRTVLLVCLGLALCLSLFSCGDDGYYQEVKSSIAWRKTLLEIGGEDVSFELIRFFFWRHVDDFDGGDRSLWEGEGGEALLDAAMEAVIADICDIYALFSVCEDWGMDPESDAILEQVNEYVKADVEGGYINGTVVTGYGSHDAYLDALDSLYSTDTVNRLLYRYSACLASLYTYVVVNRAEGKATVTEEALSDFYFGDDCAHVNRVYLSDANFDGSHEDARAQAEMIYAAMLAAGDDYDQLVKVGFSRSPTLEQDPSLGLWYGRYATDTDESEVYNTIFSLKAGELSGIIETSNGFYIIYGMEKTASDLSSGAAREVIEALYFEELCYRMTAEKSTAYRGSVAYRSAYKKLSYEKLSENS